MSIVDFQVELSRTNELLERIAVALERAIGPLPIIRDPLPPSDRMYDASPGAVLRARRAANEAAAMSGVQPGTPAVDIFMREMEDAVRQMHGDDAVDRLPWRIPSK